MTYEAKITSPTGPIYQGDVVYVAGDSYGVNWNIPRRYSWAFDGGSVEGVWHIVIIDTKDCAPGKYTIKGRVTQGEDSAECEVDFEVLARPVKEACSHGMRPGMLCWACGDVTNTGGNL